MNLTTYKCLHCGGEWEAPEVQNLEWWRLLAKKRRGHMHELGAFFWLENEYKWGNITIKNIVGHQVYEYGICRNCNSKLTAEGAIVCGNCNFLNYNFK